MTATTKNGACESLVLLRLLSFNVKNTGRNNNRNTVTKKGDIMWKKNYYENDLAKADF